MKKTILANAEELVRYRNEKRELFKKIQTMRVIDAEKAKKALTEWETDPTDEEIELVIDNLPAVDAEPVVHCQDCTIKKAVPHKDGMVWRCPHRTGDVNPEGYCEYGKRGNSNE